jgi:hypothetical protein
MEEQHHVALPKLYGAPAYARPPAPVEEKPRPFNPDDMPITAFQTDEERRFVESLPARAYAPGGAFVVEGRHAAAGHQQGGLSAKPFRLRTLAGRLFGGNS